MDKEGPVLYNDPNPQYQNPPYQNPQYQIPSSYQVPPNNMQAQQYNVAPQNNVPYGQPVSQYPAMGNPNIVQGGALHINMISDVPLSQKKLPAEFKCNTCGYQGRTETEKEIGNAVWIWVLILCFCFPLLACIPCLMDDCKDVKHKCPSCKTFIDRCNRNAC